jgi:hypothetical protein
MNKYVIEALIGFMTSFDGERVRYSTPLSKLEALEKASLSGAKMDYAHFTKDMTVALKNERRRSLERRAG